MAVLCKSLSELEGLVPPGFVYKDTVDRSGQRPLLELTELALGWDCGLRYLVAANYPVEKAIKTACALNDCRRLSILLETPRPIFSAKISYSNKGPFLTSRMHSSPELSNFDVMVAEFTKRRESLKHLAMENLSSHQQ
jgi:hypothetical protein